MGLFDCARRPAGGWKGFCFQLNVEWVIRSLTHRQSSLTPSFTLSSSLSLILIYSLSHTFTLSLWLTHLLSLSHTHSFTHTYTDRIIQLLVPSWKTMRALFGYDIYFNSKAFVNEFVDMHTILSSKEFRFQQVIFFPVQHCSHWDVLAWSAIHSLRMRFDAPQGTSPLLLNNLTQGLACRQSSPPPTSSSPHHHLSVTEKSLISNRKKSWNRAQKSGCFLTVNNRAAIVWHLTDINLITQMLN